MSFGRFKNPFKRFRRIPSSLSPLQKHFTTAQVGRGPGTTGWLGGWVCFVFVCSWPTQATAAAIKFAEKEKCGWYEEKHGLFFFILILVLNLGYYVACIAIPAQKDYHAQLICHSCVASHIHAR